MNLEHMMKESELYALYWIAMATTGVAEQRVVHKGGLDGPPMTPEELRADAMDIARHHILNYRERAEILAASLRR